MIMAMGPDRSTMTATVRRVAVALAAALLGLSATARCHAADRAAIERLTRAWRAIEARYQKFDCRWSADVTYMARTLSGPRGELFPPADVTHAMKYRLACDGSKVRFTKEGFEYDPADLHDFIMKSFINTFDGKIEHRGYLDSHWRAGGTGFVDENGHCTCDGDSILAAVLALRPTGTSMGAPDPAALEGPTLRETIDGVECDRFDIAIREPASANRHSFFVARSADARLIRKQTVLSDKLMFELTLRFGGDESTGKVWSGFTMSTWMGNGAVERTSTCADVVIDRAPSLSASEFRYVFPKGFGVRHNQTGQVALSRGDGTFRFVTHGERVAGISPEELLSTPAPPEAYFYLNDQKPRWPVWKTSLAWCVAALLAALAWRAVRSRRGSAGARGRRGA